MGRSEHVDVQPAQSAEAVESAQDFLQRNFATRNVIEHKIRYCAQSDILRHCRASRHQDASRVRE